MERSQCHLRKGIDFKARIERAHGRAPLGGRIASMNVSLRPETHEDWPWLWHWRHELIDPDWKNWDSPFLHAQTRRVSYEGFVRGRAINNRVGAIIDLDGRPVGFVNRGELAPLGGGWWDWGIVIYDPADRKKGVGSTAAQMWIDNTFDMTNAHVLTLTTWSGNEATQALGRKLGFIECSRIPQARMWRGQRYDSVQMARLRSDWEADRQKP